MHRTHVHDANELERRWQAMPVGASGTVHTLVRRRAAGDHEMPAAMMLSPVLGVIGDRWAAYRVPLLAAQVSLIERRIVELLAGAPDRWHVPGDNLVVDLDLSMAALPVGSRLRAGDAVIEISAKGHTGCDTFRSRLGDEAMRWVNARPHRERRLRGVYARVLSGGTIRVRDRLTRL